VQKKLQAFVHTAACVLVFVLVASASGQNAKVVDGARRPAPAGARPASALPRGLVVPAVIRDLGAVTTPALNVPLLLMQDSAATSGPLRAGVVQDVHATSARDGQWMPLGNQGWLWTLRLRVTGAAAVRVLFENWPPPPGCDVTIYDAGDATESFGPYTESSLIAPGDFWSPILFASDVYVEYFVPAGVDHLAAESQLGIRSVVNMYRGSPFGNAGGPEEIGCHIDVTCVPEVAANASGVGILSWVYAPFSFFCSGSMINRGLGDFSPLFATAAHCINDTTAGNNALVVWFYQTAVCNGAPPALGGLPQTRSMGLLRRHVSTDWALLGLDADIPGNVQFNGIDGSGVGFDSPAPAFNISHPDGSYKRFAIGFKDDDDGPRPVDGFSSCEPGTAYVFTMNEGNGRSEPGSSGSPLFDIDHRIRGVASCGFPPICTGDQSVSFGRLDQAWSEMQPWFDPPEPVYSRVQAGQHIGVNGTIENPFDRLVQGLCSVRTGGNLRLIGSGLVPAAFSIDRPMTIHADSAPVTIQVAPP
jgi:hypothetical protein